MSARRLAPFGALGLVWFGPDSHEDHERVRRAVADHAERMGWTELARYIFAPTNALYGVRAAGAPYPLLPGAWWVDACERMDASDV